MRGKRRRDGRARGRAGDYLIVGGRDGSVGLHARDGAPLAPIGTGAGAERGRAGVGALALHPGGAQVAAAFAEARGGGGGGGEGGGGVAAFALAFSTVHGLYGSRYAFRQGTRPGGRLACHAGPCACGCITAGAALGGLCRLHPARDLMTDGPEGAP
jgi:hypothetical protein